MTITASPASPADVPNVHPARSLSMPARTAAAVTLVLSFALHAASLLIMRVTGADLAHGGDLESWLTWVAENPALANLSKTLDVLFVPFAVGSVVVYVLLGRARSPRLAWVGGVLYAGGLVSLASMEGFEAFAYMLATERVLDPQSIADIYVAPSSPAYSAAQTLFLLGVTIGLIITVVSLWRSRAVPRAAAIGLLLFLVGELTGLRVEGHLIGLACATWIAIVILRAPQEACATG